MTKPTPEDLLSTVVEADALRRQALGLSATRASVALGQNPPARHGFLVRHLFNVLGHLWAFVMMAMPAPLRRPFVQWVNAKMGGYIPKANPDLAKSIESAVRLAKELKHKTREWPALLVMTSHPDTEGPHQWLRFELLRQGLQIADAVVEARDPGAWYPVHPRCFLAIDPFALDTVSAPVGGFYAAWMHRIYVAWDRQPSAQSWIQKHLLLRDSGYSRIGWKLLKLLKADTPVLMAMGGGLPYNARLLYGVREFVQRLPIGRWTVTKRHAQLELMRILMKPEGDLWPAERGEIPSRHVEKIREALRRWGLEAGHIEPEIQKLQAEFKLTVPYRERLLRVLSHRLAERGKPVILIGIAHSDKAPHVWLGEPVELPRRPEDISAFAQQFATTHFRALE